jgi:hypothetical protein
MEKRDASGKIMPFKVRPLTAQQSHQLALLADMAGVTRVCRISSQVE